MIDLEYSRYISELLMDQKQTKEMLSRRLNAIRKVCEIAFKCKERWISARID